MFDTGATFVSLKKSFATAAKIDIDEDSIVTLNTANGVTTGKRGRARNVQLKNLKAENVVVVVQNDDKLMAGDKLDGLLGMSLLSRFNITIGADSIRIKSRTGR
jgi:aspartyl protease family protein